MFYVFDFLGNFYKKLWNEEEAEWIAFCVGGYYVESGAY